MKIKRIGNIPTDEDLKLYLNQRIIPVRFCYLNEGGNKWHELRQDKTYELGERELKTFSDGLTNIKDVIGVLPINLVHLGPGDGIETSILFDKFKTKSNGMYVGVDISEEMIYSTLRLNKSYFSDANSLWYLTDIESEGNLELVCKDVKKKGVNRNLIILSNEGTLLSNSDVFRYLRNSMNKEDYLFLTLEGDDPKKREEIYSTYKLLKTQNLLAIGLRTAGYITRKRNFRVCFNEIESRVEVYFKPKDEQEVLCLASYKPRKDEFRNRLINSGFHIEFLKFYEDLHTFAVLCKKGGEDV